MKKSRIIVVLSLTVVILLVASEIVIANFFAEFDTPVRFVAPVYFWLLYSGAVMLLKSSSCAGKFTKCFMAFKSIKMLLSLMVALILAFAVRDQAAGIVISFFAYYIIMLVPESISVIHLKKYVC